MKILMLAPGISIHSQRFLQMLLDAGHTVTLIDSFNPKPDGAKRYSFISYPEIFGLERLGLRTINRWLAPRLIALQLRLIWQRINPDIAHVHWIDKRAYHCALAKLDPMVLTAWGSDINNFFETDHADSYSRRLTICALSSAKHLTADTHQVLERCELLSGKKLVTSLFYFGIDLEKFRPNIPAGEVGLLREKFGIPVNARAILSIRRVVPMMGHHHILRAFASVVAQTSENLVLLFHHYLNKDRDYENKLRSLADELGVSQRIFWLEDLADEQMPALYSLADLVINYPDYDGLPVSLFEAAACKKVVITNGLPAYREILGQGAFTVVSAGDAMQLEKAIADVLETPVNRLEPQLKKNYELIVQLADQNRSIHNIEQVYAGLTKNAGDAQI